MIRTSIFTITLTAISLIPPTTAQQNDPFKKSLTLEEQLFIQAPKVIQVRLELFGVKQDLLYQLKKKYPPVLNAAPLYNELVRLYIDDKVTLVDSFTLVSLPGDRALAKSIHSIISPQEYQTPSDITKLTIQKKNITKKVIEKTHLIPTSYKNQSTGSTFELVASLTANSPLEEIQLRINYKKPVISNTNITLFEYNNAKSVDKITAPKFHTITLTNSIKTNHGKPFLLGIVPSNSSSPEQNLIVMVTAYLTSTEKLPQ